MNDVLIIDDAISIAKQDEIEQMFSSTYVTWYYSPNATRPPEESTNVNYTFANAIETSLFTHVLWDEENKVNSPFFYLFAPVISAIPYVIDELIRIKVNMTLPTGNINTNLCNLPHIDSKTLSNFVSAIYYINDCSGDTIIYNECQDHVGEVTIKQRITPKKGRLVVFNGNLLHSGNNPTVDTPRLTVNFLIIPYKSNF
jgi:hypothetical protein